ncbi:MAG: DUF2069 domain-containing protein [Gammaproteobacteria bacterium]|nr:DUF2069 domain-containing protein [Gammaproteobacteria bacterium]
MTMSPDQLHRRLVLWRWCTLVGYFGLLLVLLNWFTWLSPPTEIPRGFLLILLVVPLMFPLQGILKGRPYTHSWACFLALPYFAIGIDVAFNNTTDRPLALAVTFFSLLLFFGCAFFARYERQRQKQSSVTQAD